MKKQFLFFFLLCTLSVHAVERVSLEQLQSDWSRYTGQTVQITTPLVVCGSFYDSLVLAPHRLFCPEERALGLAEGDSTMYYQLEQFNHESGICVHCRNAYYTVRTGDIVRGLQARVTSERHLVTGRSVRTHHVRPEKLARKQKDCLRVVGANVENYFADLGGYATKRTTPEQQALKTDKLVQALRSMKADIYALCEMQVGTKAPQMLLKALNQRGPKYAFVAMPCDDADRIGGCFLYRIDRVTPYASPVSAYADTTSHYYARMFAQAFEDKKSGNRLIISLNHLKSKRAGRNQYDTNRKRLDNTDSLLAMLPQAVELFGDEDVLLLGDYNCYTQEAPIVKLVQAGYADMLPLGHSGDYSYSFKGEAGYLDRCFASPSMIPQVVHVQPWHINADWYYQHGAYKMKDKTLHRYADHDPIIVDIKLK